MIFRRKVYKVRPEQVEPFTRFFEEYLLPNQLKHGAEIVGRWVSEDRSEIIALWRYRSRADYERIEGLVRQDEMHRRAQERRRELGDLFLESSQDFLEPTGRYGYPRHKVSAAGYITNERGEVLLVKTFWRSETWEIPGGLVHEGESPLEAVVREVREESGIDVRITGLTGAYCNGTTGIVNLVFRGVAVGGELRTSDETAEVRWQALTPENVGQWITRPQYALRVLDAMRGLDAPCTTYQVRPYEVRERIVPGVRRRGAVILVRGDEVALVQRVRDGQTYYLFPGGGVEPGETPDQATQREALEELGLNVRLERLGAVVEFGQNLQYFYLATVGPGQEFGLPSGPELTGHPDYVSRGSYTPVWVPVATLLELDVRPHSLAEALASGALLRAQVTIYLLDQ